MDYFFERIRLAHLCREMVDVIPFPIVRTEELSYDMIIALDKKLQHFLATLPFFFKWDGESRRRSQPLEEMWPCLVARRYCILTSAHSRRWTLHQRFLVRQNHNPAYSYSRRACLESARTVLDLGKEIVSGGSELVEMSSMPKAAHYMHLALVILVLDLCFNKKEAEGAAIKAEFKSWLQVFEDCQLIRVHMDRSLESLRHVLQKHSVSFGGFSTSLPENVALSLDNALQSSPDTIENPSIHFTFSGSEPPTTNFRFDATLDDMWQNALHDDADLDLGDWDNFFSALDSQPL